MTTLVPGAAIIYERANGVVYARYRDAPHNTIPRWIVGGDPAAVAKEQGEIIDYIEWQNLCAMALEFPTLKKQLDKIVTTYYIIKSEHEQTSS